VSRETTKPNKWRDENGNVYTVEKTTRNGRFVVIRTNPGGNRKMARQIPAVGSAPMCRRP
jgi:arginine repressor